jgi:hypothetical protein
MNLKGAPAAELQKSSKGKATIAVLQEAGVLETEWILDRGNKNDANRNFWLTSFYFFYLSHRLLDRWH